MILAVGDTDNGDNELTDHHAESAPDQKWSPAKPLNGPKGNRSRADIDQGGNQTNQERIFDGSKFLEKGRSVIEDEVDTSPLLHHLHRGTENGPTYVAAWIEQ